MESNATLNLGELKKQFGPNMANARTLLYVIPVFILVGLVLIARIPVGGIAMLVIAGVVFWGYRAQLKAKTEVYANGVVMKDWLGRSCTFHWEDVSAVYEHVGYDVRLGRWVPRTWVYWVHLMDGRKLKVDMAYEHVQSIGHMILSETGRMVLPQVLDAYKAGQTVSFGDALSISPQGFVSGGQTLAWADVGEINFTETADLKIFQPGKRVPWKLIMHAKIANFSVFRAFLHEVIKDTPAAASFKDPAFDRVQKQPTAPANAAAGNIGSLSATVGYDVRDLIMEGYDLKDIHRVASGEITLDELRRIGTKKKGKK